MPWTRNRRKPCLADATAKGDALAGLAQLERTRMAYRAKQARGEKPVVPPSFTLPEPRKPIAAQPRRRQRKPEAAPIKDTQAEHINLGPPEQWGTQLPEED